MTSKPNAFLRTYRIRATSDFARAYKLGSRARGDVLLVIARKNEHGVTRLGLSVGKRIWKSAVRRNRVRRIFREAFRLEHAELPDSYDLVLIPACPALNPELAQTRKELVRLARKAVKRNEKKVKESLLAAKDAEESASPALPETPVQSNPTQAEKRTQPQALPTGQPKPEPEG
ncbi:MAG: ribonuclease P protein component [Planctomycetota bacterium]|jgi:ribonuclease P protein component